MTAPAADRWLCGWRVRTDIPLPDVAAWQGDDRAPDVVIRLGRVPARSGHPAVAGAFAEAWPDGSHRFAHDSHGIYDVDSEGREVIVETNDPLAADVRMFLLTVVLSALCLKRQLFPLHASAAVIDGEAVAFVGNSGVGKSTIAAALMRQGHLVLADDVTVIDSSAADRPQVWPTFPYLKLCGDALEHLQLASAGPAPNKRKQTKYYVSAGSAFVREPVPLKALFHLGWDAGLSMVVIDRVRGTTALRAAMASMYRHRLARRLVPERQLQMTVGRVCAGVPVHAVARRAAAHPVEALLDEVRAALRA